MRSVGASKVVFKEQFSIRTTSALTIDSALFATPEFPRKRVLFMATIAPKLITLISRQRSYVPEISTTPDWQKLSSKALPWKRKEYGDWFIDTWKILLFPLQLFLRSETLVSLKLALLLIPALRLIIKLSLSLIKVFSKDRSPACGKDTPPPRLCWMVQESMFKNPRNCTKMSFWVRKLGKLALFFNKLGVLYCHTRLGWR